MTWLITNEFHILNIKAILVFKLSYSFMSLMKMSQPFSRLTLTYILSLCLFLQVGLNAAFSSYKMASLQANKSVDSLLICTGKSVKWISASHFFETGELLEIEQNQIGDANTQHDLSCVYSVFAEIHAAIDGAYIFSATSIASSEYFELYLGALIPSDPSHSHARAPPSMLRSFII